MKRAKNCVCALLVFVLMLTSLSCADDREPTDYYPHHAELALTIPPDYAEFESGTFDAAFTDGSAVIGITRLSFQAIADGVIETFTVFQFAQWYAEDYKEENGIELEILMISDTPYCFFTSGGYYTLRSFYRSRHAFFIVTFMCVEEKAELYAPKFLKYADEAYLT